VHQGIIDSDDLCVDFDGIRDHSVVADVQVSFDPDNLELSINSPQPLPKVSAINRIDHDILGKTTGTTRVAGPLADPGLKRVWKVDPRIQKA